MVARKITFLSILLLFLFSSCATLFKTTLPYRERENYIYELDEERRVLESLQNKVPQSDLDMAIRLNITLKNAIKEGREPRYVLFLYKIYSQKLTALLNSVNYIAGRVTSPSEVKPPLQRNHPESQEFQNYPSTATMQTSISPSVSEEKECDFASAVEDFNNQQWKEAYSKFQKCLEEGVRVDEAGSYLRKIEQRVILPEWNRANLLVYQGRSESDPARKREFLEKAKEILLRLNEDYPDNRYSPKIEKNIEVINRLLDQLSQ